MCQSVLFDRWLGILQSLSQTSFTCNDDRLQPKVPCPWVIRSNKNRPTDDKLRNGPIVNAVKKAHIVEAVDQKLHCITEASYATSN